MRIKHVTCSGKITSASKSRKICYNAKAYVPLSQQVKSKYVMRTDPRWKLIFAQSVKIQGREIEHALKWTLVTLVC